jgi:lauroyl/myristoyl acyltransferase
MLTYRLLRIASWLSRFIPSRVAYWLCSLLGGIIFYVKPSVRRAVMDNMSHVLPGSSKHKRRAIARKVIRNQLKNYYDVVRLPHMKPEDVQRTITVRGDEHLQSAIAAGKGAIVVSGHMGNFAIVAQIAAISGNNVAIVAEDIQPPRLYNYINELRGHFGVKFIKMGSMQVRTIYRLLRSNGLLLLAADRDVGEGGMPVQFFDAMVDLPEGPVVLALRLNTPLIPAHAVRLRDNSSVVDIYPPMELERTGDLDKDTATNHRKLIQLIEQMILKAPDQWVVLQRVWNHPEAPSTASIPSPSPNGSREPGAEENRPSIESAKSEEPSPSSAPT